MRIGRLEIIFHKAKEPETFKEECGIWYYLPLKWGVRHYLKEGRKLHAVKLHYYRTNKKSLKESKQWVDALQEKENIIR